MEKLLLTVCTTMASPLKMYMSLEFEYMTKPGIGTKTSTRILGMPVIASEGVEF